MEQEDIERQMNELDQYLRSVESDNIRYSTNYALDPTIQRIDPLPLGRVGSVGDLGQNGEAGQVLSVSGGQPIWVDSPRLSDNLIWNQPTQEWTRSGRVGYSQWVTPGQINPTTGEPYQYIDPHEVKKESFLDAWIKAETKSKQQPISKSYNFFTSLTLTKETNGQVELSKRIRQGRTRKK